MRKPLVIGAVAALAQFVFWLAVLSALAFTTLVASVDITGFRYNGF